RLDRPVGAGVGGVQDDSAFHFVGAAGRPSVLLIGEIDTQQVHVLGVIHRFEDRLVLRLLHRPRLGRRYRFGASRISGAALWTSLREAIPPVTITTATMGRSILRM